MSVDLSNFVEVMKDVREGGLLKATEPSLVVFSCHQVIRHHRSYCHLGGFSMGKTLTCHLGNCLMLVVWRIEVSGLLWLLF